MPNTKNLQCTSINDLIQKATVNYTGKEPRCVYTRLSAVQRIGIEAKEHGNDEKAFIYLKRWVDAMEWLKKSRDFKSVVTTDKTTDQMNQVKNILTDLRRKLEIHYKQISKEKSQNNTVEQMEVETEAVEVTKAYVPSNDITLKLPETPTDDPLYGDSDKFILCDQMYHLLQKAHNRCLIIDIRQKDHYDNSKISSDRCINIPQTEIKLGLIASHFLKYLYEDKHAHDLFKHRSARYTDIIILLDWNTTQESLTSGNYLNILKRVFEEWDPGVRYKKIKFLNGGYQEWLTRYPSFTTNHNVTMPEVNNMANEILDTIEYPEWLNSDDEDNVIKRAQNKQKTSNTHMEMEVEYSDSKSAFKHAKSNNSATSSMKSTNHVISSIDGKRSPQNNNRNVQCRSFDTVPQPEKTSSKIPQNETNTKPVIDRSNKPITLKTEDPHCKEVLRYINELYHLAKSKEKLTEELLLHERPLYLLDNKNGVAIDEEYLRTEIKSLKHKINEMHEAYLKTENEYNTYRKEIDSIKFNRNDMEQQMNIQMNLWNMLSKIKRIEEERKQIQEDYSKREHKEIRQNDSDIHKQPLKTDDSSIKTRPLERSYSSPNLQQLGDRKTPQIDRTSKPHISTHNQNGSIRNENVKLSPLNWGNREERMTPIHGSVNPGITGLKNLGNSCYMNSIIQCLSNTTHLAKYLTDNSYTDDLNTSKDNMTQGQVVEEVAQVIKALWRGQYKSISPYDLKAAVGQNKLQFESYDQQDSHEFLTFLLDWMHNDLKKELQISIEMSNAEKEWDKAMNSQKSIISDLFFGQLRSTITCLFCKQASTTYETFNSLTMSLSHSNRCTLNDCVEKFVTGQKVIGWKCPKCQKPRDATKKFDFVKLAPIVVIHLNRFADSGGSFEKRNTAVDFPLTGFNLKPYLVIEDETTMSNNIQNYNYTLYAMSNHHGTMSGGHYTAFCKNAAQNKWYKYDDQTVTEVSLSLVKSQNASAYLLFYTSLPNTIM